MSKLLTCTSYWCCMRKCIYAVQKSSGLALFRSQSNPLRNIMSSSSVILSSIFSLAIQSCDLAVVFFRFSRLNRQSFAFLPSCFPDLSLLHGRQNFAAMPPKGARKRKISQVGVSSANKSPKRAKTVSSSHDGRTPNPKGMIKAPPQQQPDFHTLPQIPKARVAEAGLSRIGPGAHIFQDRGKCVVVLQRNNHQAKSN